MQVSFSLGLAIDVAVRTAIRQLPARAWTVANETDGTPRDGALVAEINGFLGLTGLPTGIR
jgi:hypothetical protein